MTFRERLAAAIRAAQAAYDARPWTPPPPRPLRWLVPLALIVGLVWVMKECV